MTRLDALLAWAQRIAAANAFGIVDDEVGDHARTVIDTLGRPQPTFIDPPIIDRGVVPPLVLTEFANMSAGNAIALGAQLIRSGFEAEEGS